MKFNKNSYLIILEIEDSDWENIVNITCEVMYDDDSYIIGNEIIVENEDLNVSYKDVGDNKYYVYYKISDIYNNEHYTEPMIVQ